jgi:hypothetical protein
VSPAISVSMLIASLRKGASGERDPAAVVDCRPRRRGGGQGGCGEDHGNGCDRPCRIGCRPAGAGRRTRRQAHTRRAGRCAQHSPTSRCCISAPDALDEYLRDHGFARIAKRLNRTGVIDVVGTAAPGIDDIVVLGKIKQLERSGDYDLIVVDGPAAGHAITFLMSAAGLADAVAAGPVRAAGRRRARTADDPERCQVVLVTLPETTPVNEVVETAYALEDDVGVQLGPVVVNGVDPASAIRARRCGARRPWPISIRCAGARCRRRRGERSVASRRAMERGDRPSADELPIPKVTSAGSPPWASLPASTSVGHPRARRQPRARLADGAHDG